jgi:hypothetical protein
VVDDIPCRALLADPAAVQPDRGAAPFGEQFFGMRGEHQNSGAPDQVAEAIAGLFQERGIDGTDALVQQQDLWVDTGDHTERESHPHAGRVGAQRQGEVVTEFGEFDDVVDPGLHLLAAHAEEQPADDDVLVSGDLRIHADPQVEDRRDTAADPRRATGRLVNPGQHAQQRGLACAVVPNQADSVPLT